MMQKIVYALLIGIMVFGAMPVYAQEGTRVEQELTEAQVERVRASCLVVQASLSRIHAHDGLTRVNLGRQLDAISSRLMAPLNARIAVNKLDGIELARTTVNYTDEFKRFDASYRTYEKTLSSAINTDCAKQPVGFYDILVKAREERILVHESLIRLEDLVRQYRTQFTEFSDKTVNGGKSGES